MLGGQKTQFIIPQLNIICLKKIKVGKHRFTFQVKCSFQNPNFFIEAFAFFIIFNC